MISAVPAGGKVTLRNLTVLGNLDANGSSLDLLRCKVTGETTLPSKLGPTGNEVQLIVVQSDLQKKLVSIIFSAAPLSVPVGGVITIESTGATVK